jgi:hypothetical protein
LGEPQGRPVVIQANISKTHHRPSSTGTPTIVSVQ